MGLKVEQYLPPQNRRDPDALASMSSSHLLQILWADYTSILILALLTIGVWVSPMYCVESRVVPLWLSGSDGSIYDLRPPMLLEYPWRPEPLPSWSCGFVVVCVPLLVVAAFQIQTRRLWGFHAGVVGILKAVVTT